MVVSNCRSQWRSYVAIVLVLLILIVGWVSLEIRNYRRIAPGENAQHLDLFLKNMPPIDSIYARQSGGTTYLEVVGTLPPLPSLPSGPPTYIFDSTGSLVDWTSDYGDDSAFERRWPLGATRQRLTPREALELVEKTDGME